MWNIKRLNNILKQQSCYNETCGLGATNDWKHYIKLQ